MIAKIWEVCETGCQEGCSLLCALKEKLRESLNPNICKYKAKMDYEVKNLRFKWNFKRSKQYIVNDCLSRMKCFAFLFVLFFNGYICASDDIRGSDHLNVWP